MAARARERGDRRAPYTIGVVGAVPAHLWFYTATTYARLVAFVTLQAAIDIAEGPYKAIIPDYVEPQLCGLASSWMSAYQSLGNAAGLLLAGFVHGLRIVGVTLASALVGIYAKTVSYAPQRTMLQSGDAMHERLVSCGPLGVLLIALCSIAIGFFTLLGSACSSCAMRSAWAQTHSRPNGTRLPHVHDLRDRRRRYRRTSCGPLR